MGSANIDYVVATERLPGPGETVSGGTLLVNHGGKGANQAVAARRLGADVRFVGCVGDDAAGAAVRAALAREGIGVDGLGTTAAAATGTALIVVDAAGRNQIAVAPGANHRLTVEAVARRAGDVAWADVVMCQLETPLDVVAHVLSAARGRRVRTMLNPAPVRELPKEVWPLVDCLTPNEGEAARLSGVTLGADVEAAAAEAGRVLRARGVGVVVVTLGELGALVRDAGGAARIPAPAVTAVDTTAAGDAFNGALAVALAEGEELAAAVRFAVVAGSLACTRRGAQPSLPSRAEVQTALVAGRGTD